MKTIILPLFLIVFIQMSCKKESPNIINNSDTVTVPDREKKVPVPDAVDTLVAAPKSDTTSSVK
ncbi:hypothetical protein CHRY9390_00520 [Chryseobacterium aquaeductus]|uniref:Uncharacterized protein n=1 Tax=Chryseobacterium aquaeductus TaxID=2675056 RepID=A0A9N8ML31_9FLAO|nr:hypothetical protein [Chryseobacterium aquaeductus]CAA7329872.1 hypothetical protein CHRY9390_00520 [Chryseobacterium potabilaquae]CAD7799675.1 hypothetical protein CHRY9390_00520 [Chryseobacterium aquaeductus]